MSLRSLLQSRFVFRGRRWAFHIETISDLGCPRFTSDMFIIIHNGFYLVVFLINISIILIFIICLLNIVRGKHQEIHLMFFLLGFILIKFLIGEIIFFISFIILRQQSLSFLSTNNVLISGVFWLKIKIWLVGWFLGTFKVISSRRLFFFVWIVLGRIVVLDQTYTIYNFADDFAHYFLVSIRLWLQVLTLGYQHIKLTINFLSGFLFLLIGTTNSIVLLTGSVPRSLRVVLSCTLIVCIWWFLIFFRWHIAI